MFLSRGPYATHILGIKNCAYLPPHVLASTQCNICRQQYLNISVRPPKYHLHRRIQGEQSPATVETKLTETNTAVHHVDLELLTNDQAVGIFLTSLVRQTTEGVDLTKH